MRWAGEDLIDILKFFLVLLVVVVLFKQFVSIATEPKHKSVEKSNIAVTDGVKYYGYRIVVTYYPNKDGAYGFIIYGKKGEPVYVLTKKFRSYVEAIDYAEEYVNEEEN